MPWANDTSVLFDGANDFGTGIIPALSFPHSTSIWAKFNLLNQPAGNYDHLLNIGTHATNRLITISRFASDNNIYCYTGGGGGRSCKGGVITGQEWHNVILLVRSTPPYLTFHVDGAIRSLDQQPTTNVNVDVGAISLGRFISGSHNANANVTKISHWSKELDVSDIAEIWNNGMPKDLSTHTSAASLIHRWPCGEGDTFPTLTNDIGSGDITLFNMSAGSFVADVPGGGTSSGASKILMNQGIGGSF